MRFTRFIALATVGVSAVIATGLMAAVPSLASPHHLRHTFIGRFHRTRLIASTVPFNGDVNPYGVAVVRHNLGRLRRGNVLVSNFNNKSNLQGTGSTIVQITPHGHRTVFAHIWQSALPRRCPGGIGLTTALVIVHGWVIVGSTPSRDGTVATSGPGCLLVLDNRGRVRELFTGHGINGPWDATAITQGWRGTLFVTNVLNGTKAANGRVVRRGTVLRFRLSFHPGRLPRITNVTRIGSGFFQQSSASAFVIGPTGVGLARCGSLYVADTGENRITVIPHALTRVTSAGTGAIVSQGGFLNGPLGLAIAPNGHVLTVNSGDGRIVETTPRGRQVATKFLDRSGSPPGAGALFGLAVAPHGAGVYYVDDAVNTLRLLF